MYQDKRILAVIPGKKTSRRLPEKNLKSLAGRPLISYSVEQAKNSTTVDRVILSTDCDKLAYIGEAYGADIIKRPAELATDAATVEDVVLHVLESLPETYEIVVCLQPTSPLRFVADIDDAIRMLVDRPNVDSVVGVTLFRAAIVERKKGYIQYIVPETPEHYRANGTVYVSWNKRLKQFKSFYMPHTLPYIMPENRSIDIDTPFDFEVAEFFMRKRTGEEGVYKL